MAVECPHSGPVALLQTGTVGEEVLLERAPSPHQQRPVHYEREVVEQVQCSEQEERTQEPAAGKGEGDK